MRWRFGVMYHTATSNISCGFLPQFVNPRSFSFPRFTRLKPVPVQSERAQSWILTAEENLPASTAAVASRSFLQIN